MNDEVVISSMTPILLQDLGTMFATENSKNRIRFGLYQCQYCGTEFKAMTSHIKNGHTKSCGCYQKIQARECNKKHGLVYHPLYHTWKMMEARCYNPNATNYKDYGGRGIQVCERWLDIRNFIEDIYPSYQEGLTLDRIDVNGNYESDNCRWVSQNTQSRNTRELRINNTSGFRGVSWNKNRDKWMASITVDYRAIHLGYFLTALEAGKAYERYVRLNNLEHNFTSALTEDEVKSLNILRTVNVESCE